MRNDIDAAISAQLFVQIHLLLMKARWLNDRTIEGTTAPQREQRADSTIVDERLQG
jgi:hypothetical protein